jgi:hypothetical protein
MWKSKKFIVIAVLVAVVIVGSTAGIVMAQAGKEGPGPRQALLARVAQILRIDQQTLTDAFKKAAIEQRDAGMDTWLKKLVSDGKITQPQAYSFKAWLKARPDVPPAGPKGLEQLLKDGKITQQQLDAFNKWMKDKPDIPLPKPDMLPRPPDGSKGPRPPRGGPGPMPK